MTRITARHASRPTSRRFFLHAVMAASAVAALLPGRPAHADALANIQKAGVIRVAI
ncbi:amino acid ABC transporter substrate-binding protein, partial [Escherichia coli]|nr:amino acid ABC transporter substrate-binding protein [Escherichia coli]